VSLMVPQTAFAGLAKSIHQIGAKLLQTVK
jgi:hypothetical protein